ncbi:MAG: PQQ-dependent sugar dehydrogenase [Planctomycetaceae bacterium]|nr:PQQ-dependent sugar dehydrogenase [Planctomycetaceae bacterium]
MRPVALTLFVSLIGILSGSAAAEVPVNGLTPAEKLGGWELLFDGRSMEGWRNYQKQEMGDGWAVSEGAIHWKKKKAGDIITKEQFENFELSLEYRISKGGNSGLMFHVLETEARPWQTGPEVQIQDNVDGHDPQKAGWLYQLYKPVKPRWAARAEQQAGIDLPDIDDATRPAGEWNQLYLRISPRLCQVAVNGVAYYTFRKGDAEWDKRVAASKFAKFAAFGKATKGHICLQDHGNPVSFRNIKVRRLAADGSVPSTGEQTLDIASEEAFPQLKWEGFEGVDEQGRIRNIRPMALTHAGDGSNRIFAGTQRGAIYVFKNRRDVEQATFFLDLRGQVADWKKNNEEGFLGLAFHPEYASNGSFYVYYTSADEPRTSIVSRFQVSADDPNKADPDSEQVVMKIDQPFSNHNGGSIAFGKDGYLYIGLGDGGGRNDPLRNGQNLQTLMGSILRIDVNRQESGKGYAIPADNPFVGQENVRPEIYAYGFRNVWRMTVDRMTGDLWAADVGQDFWEEINIVKAGGNYGWSVREASYPFNNIALPENQSVVEPVWEYDHQTGKSITGGFVYRGSRIPELQGMYLYADYISGRIWALKYDAESGKVVQNAIIAKAGFPVLAFGEDEQGEVYYTIETVNGRSVFHFGKTQ